MERLNKTTLSAETYETLKSAFGGYWIRSRRMSGRTLYKRSSTGGWTSTGTVPEALAVARRELSERNK